MRKIIFQRVTILLVMLLFVSVVAFCLPLMSSGDPARAIMMSRVSDMNLAPEAVEALRRELGLDRPLMPQYFSWLGSVLQGDFGYSFATRRPVSAEIGRALGVSIMLALSALGVALAVALPLGTIAAMRPGGKVDGFTTLLIQTLVATPEYWFAPVSILVFALWLGVLPSAGWESWQSLVLPTMALMLRPMAYFTQVTRASMRDVLEAPYITAARARGLSMNQAVVHHGVRNGSMPVITFFALWFAGLLGGSVVIEVIFAVPGMGRLLYEAVVNRDVPMLQGGFVAIVGLSIVINTIADVLYVVVNPAMRGEHGN
jgi:peptide/nickel transport system permease protein